jgi:hypothetical protein
MTSIPINGDSVFCVDGPGESPGVSAIEGAGEGVAEAGTGVAMAPADCAGTWDGFGVAVGPCAVVPGGFCAGVGAGVGVD